MPDASWKGLAAGLYRREKKTALEALKEYLGDRQGEFELIFSSFHDT